MTFEEERERVEVLTDALRGMRHEEAFMLLYCRVMDKLDCMTPVVFPVHSGQGELLGVYKTREKANERCNRDYSSGASFGEWVVE